MVAIALMLEGCNNKSSQNELYAFLDNAMVSDESNQMLPFFNKSYEYVVNQLGSPDSIIVSPFDYYRPYSVDKFLPDDGCEGTFVDKISCLQDNIPGFVFVSAIWRFSDERFAKPNLTISFLPRGDQMVSFYLKNYDNNNICATGTVLLSRRNRSNGNCKAQKNRDKRTVPLSHILLQTSITLKTCLCF